MYLPIGINLGRDYEASFPCLVASCLQAIGELMNVNLIPRLAIDLRMRHSAVMKGRLHSRTCRVSVHSLEFQGLQMQAFRRDYYWLRRHEFFTAELTKSGVRTSRRKSAYLH